ncbi:binding-protein-dependent transport system inner membrane protein [Clostridium tetanomorphum DSM 665]|uniref:Sugar ABC transporter permease n=2 Tax=Clostridium tetanomorphum TaxID=1553 RepID=A0A923EBR4_CLOTT|nr:sugar ABC transporter permease [Clostridium tetanomorphum]KAJ50552.1 binding-protein-dependent transport system inner membrane protein [Clostridium tetanomorphum DSM 665]MBC2400140.1 sugar ABC transporter permease [Clostridium tetanomorphum]MBP1866528.1 multiple sugar transport system permease protein [Clostridium tetanomorphum]NRZ95446.1 multiple sugar transport system permease protein [Clostridium tetanomorphum]
MKIKRKNIKLAMIFLFPSILGFFIFYILPFMLVIKYSFLDSPNEGEFVGFSNFISLLQNPSFKKAILNTLIFTSISVPLLIVISLGVALLLNQNLYLRNIFRMFFMLPLVIPVASVVMVWHIMVDNKGWINKLVISMGYSPVDWMNSKWALFVVIVVFLWKNIGYNMILFIAALQNIPKEYYEYASIEGASAVKKFTNITIVYMMPTLFFVFVISIINSFKVFREVYLIAGEYPHESIYMLQHYMNNVFMSLDYQKLSSAAVIMALGICLLLILLFKLQENINNKIQE